jgi:amidase
VQAWEVWQAHGAWIKAHPGSLGPDVAGRFAQAAQVTETQAQAAREVATAAGEQIRGWLAESVLVLPSAAGPAPGRTAGPDEIEGSRAATLRMTLLAGLSGAPAVSLPLLRSAEGLPVGLCLIGAPHTDRALLTLAAPLLPAEH